MILEIAIILLLIIANGVFAMSEAALISARKARLQQRANEGDARARAALELANNPGAFLATVQVGITLIGVLAGAFGGATIANSLAEPLRAISFLRPYAEAVAFFLVVLATTYLSLIVGELVPKQLALNNPERIAGMVASPMSAMARAASPLVHFLNTSTSLLIRLIGARPSEEPDVTEEEIKVLIDQGTRTGQFAQVESELVGGVFRLADVRVSSIMTPRVDVVWFDTSDTPEAIQQKIATSGHSRFPVAEGSLDNVIGVVRTKDMLMRALAGESFDLRACMQPPLFMPESLSALKALTSFREQNTHIALVIDEYGGFQGVVTITDVLEEIVGGGYLSEEPPQPTAVRREDGSWLLDGRMTIDEVEKVLPDAHFPDESEREYETLGGFIMNQIGRIPTTADTVELGALRFEVVDMDGYRVDKVLAVPSARDGNSSSDTVQE